MTPIETIFEEIKAERARQDAKWGLQNHPDLDPTLSAQGRFGHRMCEEHEIPAEWRAKTMCKTAFEQGRGTWAHIFIEEVSEAIATNSTEKLRQELIQVVAVGVAWIEAIDRRKP